MPTYEYTCQSCDHAFEQFQSMRDEPLKECPECGKKKLKRHIGAGAGLIFKGTGFYITDYKKKSGGELKAGETKASESKSGESKADVAKTSESKAGEGKASEAKSAGEAKSSSAKPAAASPAKSAAAKK